jgi:hypothetical protein
MTAEQAGDRTIIMITENPLLISRRHTHLSTFLHFLSSN